MKKSTWKRITKKVITAVLMLTMVIGCFGMTGCGSDSDTAEEDEETATLYDEVLEKGTLVVGMNAEFSPFEFHINEDGEDKVVGIDVLLAEAIADELGVELEIQEMEFDALITSLKAGQVDIVISALCPTDERKEQVDFSDVYFNDSNVALINVSNADKFQTLEDLLGARICYQLGSYQEEITKEYFGEDNLTVLESTNTILLTLQADQIDAFITSKAVAEQACVSDSSYTYIEGDALCTEEDGCAVALPKGESEMQDAINEIINSLLESGEMDEYVEEACRIAAENITE